MVRMNLDKNLDWVAAGYPLNRESETYFSSQPEIHPAEFDKVQTCVSRLYEILHIYGLKRPNRILTKKQFFGMVPDYERTYWKRRSKFLIDLLEYTEKNGQGSWVTILKYKMAAIFSFYHNQDLPPTPDVATRHKEDTNLFRASVLIGGHVQRWFDKLLLRSFNHTQSLVWSLLHTILHFKKGSPRVPDGMVAAAVKKTVVQLTSEPKESIEFVLEDIDISIYGKSKFKPIGYEWEEASGMEENSQRVTKIVIKEQLTRTVREIFEKKKFTYKDLVRPCFPSTRANFTHSRGAGGQVGSLQKYWMEIRKSFNTPEFRTIPVTLRHRLADFRSSKTKEEQTRLDDDWSKYLWDWESEEQQVKESIGATIDTTNIEEAYETLYRRVWPDAVEEEPYVRAVGLPEPFKVRVISKGPALKYFCLKPLQKWLWKILKNNPVFELIGKPDDETLINHLFANLDDDDIIVSGDYKASTDNLHSWISECINEALMPLIQKNFPEEELELLPWHFFRDLSEMVRVCLTGHIFQNSSKDSSDQPELLPRIKVDGKIPEWLPQKEGQLMGSIISFPFLCIANAALCRYSMEVSNHKSYKLNSQIPLRVNGDDCIFSGHKDRIRSIWEKVTAFGGLETSVGKTYFSSKFCVIDSKLYDRTLRIDNHVDRYIWNERKFLNCGLLYGQSKSGFKRGKTLANIGCVHRELLRTCPIECIEAADASFLKIHRELLDSIESVVGSNWFLPEWLGGLGLDPKFHSLSSRDRALAFYVRKKISNGESPIQKMGTNDSWRLHKLVNSTYLSQVNWLGEANFADIAFEDVFGSLEQEYQKIYKLLTISLLFDPEVDPNSLQEAIDEEERGFKEIKNVGIAHRNIRALTQVDQEIYYKNLVRLIDVNDLVHIKHNRYLPLISKKI
jgi:hypothetical protein